MRLLDVTFCSDEGETAGCIDLDEITSARGHRIPHWLESRSAGRIRPTTSTPKEA